MCNRAYPPIAFTCQEIKRLAGAITTQRILAHGAGDHATVAVDDEMMQKLLIASDVMSMQLDNGA